LNILGYAGEDIREGDAIGIDNNGLLVKYKQPIETLHDESRTLIPDTIEQSVWKEWQRVWWD